ncbi:MAG: haloacid dehalogenase type II [Nitrososphaerota archaeon]
MYEFDVLTFDCYGTLVDWESGAKQVFIRILSKKKKNIPVDELLSRWLEEDFRQVQGPYRPYKEILKISLKQVMDSFGMDYSETDGEEFVSSIKSWKPFPDVEPALKSLKQKYKLAIISNIDNDIITESVKLMGIDFDYIITAEDARAYKPSRKIFEYAIERLGLKKDRILHVSFSPDYDLIPAKSLGMYVAWLDRKGVSGKSQFEYDYKFKDLLQLRDVLMRW